MDLKKEILREHSKRQTVKIADWIGSDPARFGELMEVFLGDDGVLTQRSAWILSHSGERHPELIPPWLPAILRKIQEPGVHDAARRNVVRTLAYVEIPRKLLGTVVSLCFDYLASPAIPIAVRVHSMTVLEKAVRREPGLRNEFEAVVAQMLPHAGPGLRARSRHVLKNLRAAASSRQASRPGPALPDNTRKDNSWRRSSKSRPSSARRAANRRSSRNISGGSGTDPDS